MPRLGSESNSSVRRHNPTQTLSNYFQLNSQVWQIRASGPSRIASTQTPEEAEAHFDVLDDILNRTRASVSRTRWNARPSGSPYGHRPLHKWLPSEQKHFEEMSALMEMFPEPGSDDETEEEPELHELVAEDRALEMEADDEASDEDEEEGEEGESDPEEDDTGQPPQPHSQPQSPAAAKKREKNKRKRAKARAKAKDKMKPPSASEPDATTPDAPQDLLVSMSRIAQLVGSLNTDTPDESNELLQRVRDAFTEEGRRQLGSLAPTEPAQWRAEVLQSVRRMESMLGQMEKWQAQVAPGEIEALRAETARLEVRVRAVVEQKEKERAEVRASTHATQTRDTQAVAGPSKPKDAVAVDVAEAVASDEEEPEAEEPVQLDLDGDRLISEGAEVREDHDVDSLSDSTSESNNPPSETDTGPTEPDPDDRLLPEDKHLQADPPPAPVPAPPPSTTPSSAPIPQPQPVHRPPITTVLQPAYNIPHETLSAATPAASSAPPSDAPAVSHAPFTPLNTLATKNQNVPPEPPADPVGYLTKHPWTMIEVLCLLEIVAHFPPAEHGWTFIAEAYCNILITRPLQEWFGKQATASNDEEAKMKSVLQKMNVEARQMRARRVQEAAASSAAAAGSGERGKAAPFGSAEARAEANARAKQPESGGALDKDWLIVTRLPHPLPAAGGALHAADNPANPPPAQRIVPFPRRRPPLSLPSKDARSFAHVMASAVAGARPPSSESRAAMLALYSATNARFPVRTAWDCWHRWCTPWVVQDPGSPPPDDTVPIVLDYITGNICLPAGTWITQARDFKYLPVPGTYPDVPGVQRRVTAGYDPRPGMVAFARMTHLLAEKTWAGMGLKRRPDGTVTEEVLVGRRAKLPGTLAGIWPGRAPPKAGANARSAAQPAGTQPAAARPATTQPATAQPAATPAATAQPASAQPTAPAAPEPAAAEGTADKKVRFAPLPPKAKAPPAASTSTTPHTTTNPRPPFLPLPTPRPRPKTQPPNVPEGTFGHPTKPGMATWFQRATFRVDVLERVLDLEREREKFERAVGDARADARKRTVSEDEDEERGRKVPLHLRKLVIPRPPPHIKGQAWTRGS